MFAKEFSKKSSVNFVCNYLFFKNLYNIEGISPNNNLTKYNIFLLIKVYCFCLTEFGELFCLPQSLESTDSLRVSKQEIFLLCL